MRNFITIVTETVTSEETKFWFNANDGQFFFHDFDNHHTKSLAQNPQVFGLNPDDVAHHPHAHGDYLKGSDGYDEDEAELWADNNDMGIFTKAFTLGWVRGGREIDYLTYLQSGNVRHEGCVYLQSPNLKDLRKAVKACMKRWPDIEGFNIQSAAYFELDVSQIDRFIKFGTIPATGN